jgi:glycosyltransferase involved in cell wall biosynthesis
MAKVYKIAFLLPFLESQGGVTVSVRTIAHHLQALGHEVHLFPIGRTKTEPTRFIHPIDSNNRKIQIAHLKSLFSKLRHPKPFDLIISNHLVGNYLLHKLDVGDKHLIVLRQPSLLEKKNLFSRLKKRLLYPSIYNNKDIVAISHCLLEHFLENYHYLKPKSTQVIYNAFDSSILQTKADEPIHIPFENYIINVGRFTKTKNQAALIEAFANLKDKEIHLVLLGEGKEKGNYQKLVSQKHLSQRVHFIPWQQNPYAWIKKAKLLVHTAKSETFGRVILEALALDTPVVCTDIPCGPSEILTGVLSKYLVPLNDPEKLVATIEKALEEYPKITQEHLNKFQIDTIAKSYLQIIHDREQKR